MSSLALHFFFSVEFNFWSCFLIRKIYRIHFDFLKNSFPGMLISASGKCFICLFYLLIPAGVVNASDFNSRADSGAASLLALFQTEAGSLYSGPMAQMQLFSPSLPVPSCGPSALLLRLLPVSGSSFLSNRSLPSICISRAPLFLALNAAFSNKNS